MNKKDLLDSSKIVENIDIAKVDTTDVIKAMQKMSFSARDTGRAAEIYQKMINDKDCSIILSLAGSTSSAGCMKVYADMIRYNMVDAVVATGAAIVDMDFFDALGFRHYQGNINADNAALGDMNVDRIYDTYIDEDEVEECTKTITEIANSMKGGVYSSREFIREMGRFLKENPERNKRKGSLVELAYEYNVPIFCPAFSDSTAGYGLVKNQVDHKNHVSIDSVKDFRELAMVKWNTKETGVFIVGGGVPKNFVQDVVVCTELTGEAMPRHKYAIQLTIADVRDGACSSSTFQEARSWGKVELNNEQMVFGEATSLVPLIISYIYHEKSWEKRKRRELANIFFK